MDLGTMSHHLGQSRFTGRLCLLLFQAHVHHHLCLPLRLLNVLFSKNEYLWPHSAYMHHYFLILRRLPS